MKTNKIKHLSIVIPVYNEEKNISILINEIKKSIRKHLKYEVIIVDDGSTDDTFKEIKLLLKVHKNIILIKHKRNIGQSYSLRTGILASNYDYILTLDGDGQNNPDDIQVLVEKFQINKDFYLVIGNREKRHDSYAKILASRAAFLIRKNIFNDKTPDTGCAMKVFKKKDFLLLPFFNHIHRYFPILFKKYGGDVISVKVNHRKRFTGCSKYTNFQRALVGIFDLVGVIWLSKRSCSPKVIEEKKITSNKEK